MDGLRAELVRFHRILDYCCVLRGTSNKKLKNVPKIKELRGRLEDLLYHFGEYLPEKDAKVEVLFGELLQITKQVGPSVPERDMMRFLKQPHFVDPVKSAEWYVCNNGHFYCKNVDPTCPDC